MIDDARALELLISYEKRFGWQAKTEKTKKDAVTMFKELYELGRQDGSKEVERIIKRLHELKVPDEIIAEAVFEEEQDDDT